MGDFSASLNELVSTYTLDRIIIEPSGVGKLSDVIKAVESANENLKINVLCTVCDGGKVEMYHKNFGEFYLDQISEANAIVLTKTEGFSQEKIIKTCEYIKQFNPTATIITTPVSELNGKTLLESLEDGEALLKLLIGNLKAQGVGHAHHEHRHEHHHEHHHEHGEECHCHDHEHHHEHGEECHCHDHEHHHEHGEECHCHDHEHHHEHGECCCHHHADEVFESWGVETPAVFSREGIENALKSLNLSECGLVLRAKGIVETNGGWIAFDFVPGSYEIRDSEPEVTGKICVIGSNLNSEKIQEFFKVK